MKPSTKQVMDLRARLWEQGRWSTCRQLSITSPPASVPCRASSSLSSPADPAPSCRPLGSVHSTHLHSCFLPRHSITSTWSRQSIYAHCCGVTHPTSSNQKRWVASFIFYRRKKWGSVYPRHRASWTDKEWKPGFRMPTHTTPPDFIVTVMQR